MFSNSYHEIGVPFLRNYPASYARFHQPMSVSRTYVGEVDEQLLTTIFHQTKTLRRFQSSIASSPRLSSRHYREANAKKNCKASNIKARSRLNLLRWVDSFYILKTFQLDADWLRNRFTDYSGR